MKLKKKSMKMLGCLLDWCKSYFESISDQHGADEPIRGDCTLRAAILGVKRTPLSQGM